MEFFTEHDRIRKDHSARGYIEVSDLEEILGVAVSALYTAGLVKEKEYFSTAELHSYELTDAGKEYFKDAPYQCIFLKPRKIVSVLRRASSHKRRICITYDVYDWLGKE